NLDTFFKLLLKEDFISVICRIKKMTFDELLNIFFKDYRLRSIFLLLLGVGVSATPSRVSAISAILFYKQFILDPGYYPKGGMQQVPNALGQQLQANKGEILSNKRVVRILITSGKANGVMLNDGTKIYSKLVISNADATQTFTKLLATHPTPEARRLRKMRSSSSAVILFLGVTLKLTHHLKNQSCIWISDTYDIDAQFTKINNIYKKHRLPEYTLCYFPGLHDPQLRLNRNSIQIFTNAPYTSKSFWETNKHIYEDLLYKKILKILPALQQKNIVTKFGATPHTFSRYTNNNHGALYGWESNAARINSASMPQECSIPNLILTGHWCTSGFGNVGGIPGVAGLGRNAARIAYSKLVKKWPWSYFIIK
ncbi:MAG TPA: FAD-dependent oxidoreductase, partial [Candidatus Omnitrophota bacterium]|nr:FAD-dependent oxidoreductase [Candidatus Omnitrophota bacterium]